MMNSQNIKTQCKSYTYTQYNKRRHVSSVTLLLQLQLLVFESEV